MALKTTLRAYYYLSKPGIVYGNALIAIAGYFYGAHGSPTLITFLAMLIGISAVMASACAYNNVIDRDIDAKMTRTKKRAVVTGVIGPSHALLFASVLLVLGFFILLYGTNLLTAFIALFGHYAYVALYSWAKRKTVYGTLVGTISGSTPPVIGYVAATGHLDLVALLLFFVLVAWQMAHFYSIAIFQRDDYASAKIPVLSVVKGLDATRQQIIVYVIVYIAMCVVFGVWGGASLLTTLVTLIAGLYWLYLCLQPLPSDGSVKSWARGQFRWSLMLLVVMSVMWSLDSFLH